VTVQGSPQRVFDVHEPSQVGEVRRAAQTQAQALGFDDAAAGRAALVATELGTNLVKHARGGRLLLAAVQGDDGAPLLELMSLDDGPGITDIGRSMADGYSTAGTPGTGLGAARRLSALFELHTAVPHGTLIVARIGAAAPPALGGPAGQRNAAQRLQQGAAMVCAPGETVCGDGWALERSGDRCALLMADGLGHGVHAAEAAQAAVNSFRTDPFAAPGQVIERLHAALRSTRGAAVCVVQADLAQRRVVHAGAGNISARLLSGTEDRTLLSQNGTAGVAVRRVQEQVFDWPPHAMLVLHSDGLGSRWELGEERGLLQHHPALLAAWLLRRHARGRDDATVVALQLRDP
jgi:anti-sigma regulatory factor (Ser/Thr protein kinase)